MKCSMSLSPLFYFLIEELLFSGRVVSRLRVAVNTLISSRLSAEDFMGILMLKELSL